MATAVEVSGTSYLFGCFREAIRQACNVSDVRRNTYNGKLYLDIVYMLPQAAPCEFVFSTTSTFAQCTSTLRTLHTAPRGTHLRKLAPGTTCSATIVECTLCTLHTALHPKHSTLCTPDSLYSAHCVLAQRTLHTAHR